jgi:hypothetical protein
MADTVKKAKAPAKPRKTAAKKEAVVEAAKTELPTHEQIQELARHYWAQRGYHDGMAEQDWLQAEQQLLKKAS